MRFIRSFLLFLVLGRRRSLFTVHSLRAGGGNTTSTPLPPVLEIIPSLIDPRRARFLLLPSELKYLPSRPRSSLGRAQESIAARYPLPFQR